MPASGELSGDEDPGYWRFYDEVSAVQLREWLPGGRVRVLDLSGAAGRFAQLVADAGHEVVHVCRDPDDDLHDDRVRYVVGDLLDLGGLREGAFQAVVAEACALSRHLAAECTLARIHDLLEPGGRLLLSVQSLVLGLARLAEQERWAELADVPSADVVLVPNEDGSISRCFWPQELHELLAANGFEVEWIRPRTVLSQEAVTRALRADGQSLATLVRTEIALAREREGESIGVHLVVSARKRS